MVSRYQCYFSTFWCSNSQCTRMLFVIFEYFVLFILFYRICVCQIIFQLVVMLWLHSISIAVVIKYQNFLPVVSLINYIIFIMEPSILFWVSFFFEYTKFTKWMSMRSFCLIEECKDLQDNVIVSNFIFCWQFKLWLCEIF